MTVVVVLTFPYFYFYFVQNNQVLIKTKNEEKLTIVSRKNKTKQNKKASQLMPFSCDENVQTEPN